MKRRNVNLEKAYSPEGIEQKWYAYWMSKDFFLAKCFDSPEDGAPSSKGHFSIVIPPPNVTGSLHMGHAFNNTFQDILCRTRRMQGYDVLWLPGTDHAGIATQNVVEREIEKSGATRHSLGREKFVQKVWEWKELYGNRIITQMKRLGNSCDWRRERFTLDEGLSRAVREVFVKLYKKDLIYKGKYIINWCSRCNTALSDLEVDHEDKSGKFYYVKYPFADGMDSEEDGIIISTTRPETILGDVAVAVHPRSENSRFIGRKVKAPLSDRIIPIIEDNMVDPEFGTGCVKITPAHDLTDYIIGKKHDLPQLQVIDSDGKMNENALCYQGLTIEEARKATSEDIDKLGLMVKVEEIVHSIGHCQRCRTIVEPYLSEQWFVRAKPLADRGIKAVKDGLIKWFPEQWEKTYFQWMENIRDWCISRQLWWGHRIPAWYCDECGHISVCENDPAVCEKCGSVNIVQDEDVLDTWFSSALWPFSTMGWPEDTPDLRYYYPTSLMVTGFDIIFFWVARMIMMGLEFMDEEPFKDVYIHSLIRDEKGRKMSKSTGNAIDPLDMIDKYGADGLRMALAALSTQGRDILLSSSKIETFRFFMNKLWNAARFALLNLDDDKKEIIITDLYLHDRWILDRTQNVIENTTKLIDEYNIGEAARLLYDFVWGDICDWYLEMAKPSLHGDEGDVRAQASQAVLEYVFHSALLLLHPFIPFITEELWDAFGYGESRGGKSIVISEWPAVDEKMRFYSSKNEMMYFQETVRAIRNLRAEAGLTPQQQVNIVYIQTENNEYADILASNLSQIIMLCKVKDIEFIKRDLDEKKTNGCLSVVMAFAEINLFVGDILDIGSEIVRLEKDMGELQKNLSVNLAKLGNESFIKRAPVEVVEQERARSLEAEARISRIKRNIENLKRA
ncbi:MAG: valine--tRNA ligase [Synergistaceae bacterium]|nr:valine--tRNA ligase [Synergistaceae bacterium]